MSRWFTNHAKILEGDLKMGEKLILINLHSFADNNSDECFPGVETLASMSCCSRNTILRTIATLKKQGVVEVFRRYSQNGHRSSNLYHIIFDKIPQLKSPESKTKSQNETKTKSQNETKTKSQNETKTKSQFGTLTNPDLNYSRSELEEINPSTKAVSLTAEPENSETAPDENSGIEISQLSDPDSIPTPLENSTPEQSTLLQHSNSGEGESSAACRITEITSITATGYLAQTEKRYSPTLSHTELMELTQELIDIYNKTKPSCWGTCTQITAYLTKQVSQLVNIYSDGVDIESAINSLKNDVGAAHLACKGDGFYDKHDFGIPSIAFFLTAKRLDKLQERAQVWYDRPQIQKEQLARKMVAAVNGIPRWENPDVVLTGAMLHLRRDRYKRYVEAQEYDRTDCPSIEYLQTYFPELFTENG